MEIEISASIESILEDDKDQSGPISSLSSTGWFSDSRCTGGVDDEAWRQRHAERLLRETFEHVGWGRENEAQKTLTDHPELLSKRRKKFTDIAGSVYHDIALFEYVVSEDVQDAYMARMMVQCINDHPEQHILAEQLAAQYDNVFTGRMPKSVRTLIIRLEALLNAYDQMESDEELEQAWITRVGVAQRDLKAVIRNYYCHQDYSFVNSPGFHYEKLSRSLKFYRSKTDEIRNWDSTASDLGQFFAITRWAYESTDKKPGARAFGGKSLLKVAIRADIDALKSICQVLSNDLKLLRQEIGLLCKPNPGEESSINLLL